MIKNKSNFWLKWLKSHMINWTSFQEVNASYYLFCITNVVVMVIDLVEITIDMIHLKIIKFYYYELGWDVKLLFDQRFILFHYLIKDLLWGNILNFYFMFCLLLESCKIVSLFFLIPQIFRRFELQVKHKFSST